MEKNTLLHTLTGIKGVFVKEHSPTGKPVTTIIQLENGSKFFAPSVEFTEVKKRGGYRSSSGRKPTTLSRENKPKIHCGYRLCSDVVEMLSKVDDAAHFIEEAVREKIARQ